MAATFLNATNPNLDAFKAKGHKLVIWHGWSDPALTALGSVKYHDQVVARDPKARDYMRMFMMPGVLHCAGGPGPDTVDWASVDRRLGREGQGAGPGDRAEGRRGRRRVAVASAVRLSAARDLQGNRQHR